MFIQHGYWLVFVYALVENLPIIGFFIPGTILILLAGFLTPFLGLSLTKMLAFTIVGVIAGDGIGYMLGRKYGYEILEKHGHKFGFHEHRRKKVSDLFCRYGGWSIVIARFTSVIRPLSPAFAGCIRMSHKQFWMFNILGGTAWSVTFILLGYFFGAYFPSVQEFVLNVL